jgi:hypothetical protein
MGEKEKMMEKAREDKVEGERLMGEIEWVIS